MTSVAARSRTPQVGGEFVEHLRQAGELLDVCFGEVRQPLFGVSGEPQAYDSIVTGVGNSIDQPELLCAGNQFHRSVVLDHQVLGHLANSRAGRFVVAANGEQELMVARGEPGRGSPISAPTLELS